MMLLRPAASDEIQIPERERRFNGLISQPNAGPNPPPSLQNGSRNGSRLSDILNIAICCVLLFKDDCTSVSGVGPPLNQHVPKQLISFVAQVFKARLWRCDCYKNKPTRYLSNH